MKRWLAFLLIAFAVALVASCGGGDEDDASPDDAGGDHSGDYDSGGGDTGGDGVPGDIMDPPDEMPFSIERTPAGTPPTETEIAAFTGTMKRFYEGADYFRWAWRVSAGLAEDNEWGEPGYKIWWTNAYMKKSGGEVTLTWHDPPDNTTAKVGRVLPCAIGLYLATGDEVARDLSLGYIKGLSATYEGMVWGHENPPVESIMARTIFHRNHTEQLDGGRSLTVDYDAVRYLDLARRHDTVHNPDNPVWGDIWVRNKRSKDDFPYLYRDVPLLARLIRSTDDEEIKDAAIKLYRQIGAMAWDIANSGYLIRTKGVGGEIFVPTTEGGFVDDFASFVTYDFLFPKAECNAKLGTAYLATGGDDLGNDCGDGDGGLYETIANFGHFWSANMIWGYHIAALSLSLSYGDDDAAKALLLGLARRMEKIRDSFFRDRYVEWDPEFAHTLVLSAAYGLPLTGEEAHYVMSHFAASASHYAAFPYWDVWSDAIPDGDYEYLPDRYVYDGEGQVEDAYIRIEAMAYLYEYCYSPLKAPNGVSFVDCDALFASR